MQGQRLRVKSYSSSFKVLEPSEYSSSQMNSRYCSKGRASLLHLLESPRPSAAPAEAGASLAAADDPPDPAEIDADLTWPGWRARGVWSGSLGLGEVGAR